MKNITEERSTPSALSEPVDPAAPPKGQKCQHRGSRGCRKPAYYLYDFGRKKRWLCIDHFVQVSELRYNSIDQGSRIKGVRYGKEKSKEGREKGRGI